MDKVVAHGIDVSYAQGIIDWPTVKASGQVDFVILRATASFPAQERSGIDTAWQRNITGVRSVDLPAGAYHYSYALTKEDAKKEAVHFLNIIRPYQFAYPVAFDFEEPKQIGGYDLKGIYHAGLPVSQQIELIETFLSVIESAGYYGTLYTSQSAAARLRSAYPERFSKFDLWLAQWSTKPTYQGNFGLWQHEVLGSYGTKGRDYTVYGSLPGICANIDRNYAYFNYPEIMKRNGLNGFKRPEEAPADKPFRVYRCAGNFASLDEAKIFRSALTGDSRIEYDL